MSYQANIPQPGDLISVSQIDLLNNFTSINSWANTNHVNFNDANSGKHKFVEMPNQGSDPAGAANEMTLFSKSSGGSSEVFVKRDASSTIQMTAGTPIVGGSGSTFLPGGLILKWFSVSLSGGGGVTTYASKGVGNFPNNVFSAVITNGSLNFSTCVSALTTTQINLGKSPGSGSVSVNVWILGN
jgi:hypothetical protein